jgi:hypothetical protein
MLEHGTASFALPGTLTFALPQGELGLSFPLIVLRAIPKDIAARGTGPSLAK